MEPPQRVPTGLPAILAVTSPAHPGEGRERARGGGGSSSSTGGRGRGAGRWMGEAGGGGRSAGSRWVRGGEGGINGAPLGGTVGLWYLSLWNRGNSAAFGAVIRYLWYVTYRALLGSLPYSGGRKGSLGMRE